MSTTPQDQSVPAHVLEYLADQDTLTLATASAAGIPRATTYLYVNDGQVLYFWARRSTVSSRHIEQNSVVSFAIDESAQDLSKTRGVQGMGECSVILDGETIARVADLFGRKFPSLAPGNTMSISFFRIVPTELQFIDNASAETESYSTRGEFGADFHRERAYSVFTDLPALTSESISVKLQTISAEAGTVIARQNGPADKFFILVTGAVEVVREEGDATETVANLGPGEFFGEMAVLRDKPRSSTLRATEPSTLMALDRSTFRDLVAQSLGTTSEFDQVIRERLAF